MGCFSGVYRLDLAPDAAVGWDEGFNQCWIWFGALFVIVIIFWRSTTEKV